ncbi:MAG TPA: alpha-amylase family glycosyl hydrolase [Microvirga sp.]|nr:alpha-amylase family glycosyl hydrolase [Microvirga sp.]
MTETTWWKHGIVYQIYPRSFQDTDGDGIGDLRGICQRLDYLVWLGVHAVWISPIYPSPMADFGYDVADYCGIDPIFGTMEDFDRLVAEAHARGLKVILDFVPNHTSDRHPWFQESRSSRSNPKRDWYIWCDAKPDGSPPNNWISNFGGSAWEWDEATGQYYYHAFLKGQPDLNWRNPEVREAMLDVLRFWLDRGVDGFRVDVMWHLIKDAEFRDNPPNPAYQSSQAEINRFLQVYSADQPEVHEVVTGMRRVLEEYENRVLIGEIYLPLERLVAYYGTDLSGAHLPFNFQLVHAAWNARDIGTLVGEYEALLPQGGWPNWVLGNHDQPRIGARVGKAQSRIAAMLLLTLRGTPTMYYGDEIGLGKVEIPPEAVQDPWEKNEPGLGLGRDPERTPMQWDASENAGFTTGRPWLPLDPNHSSCNVKALSKDPASILSLYRRLIELRRGHLALSIGSYTPLSAGEDVLAYERQHGSERLLVVLNFSQEPRAIALPAGAGGGRVLLSTHLDRDAPVSGTWLDVRPDEGVIVALTPSDPPGSAALSL